MTTPQPSNPANPVTTRVTEATRVPMSLPQLQLEVPEIPGYHTHWFVSKNIPRAHRAGYEFVEEGEVSVVNRGLANDASLSGSTDMGTKISVIAGGVVEGAGPAQAERLYLMKIPKEWRDRDVQALEQVNERIALALRSGRGGQNMPGAPSESAADLNRRYMKQGQDLFWPKHRPKG